MYGFIDESGTPGTKQEKAGCFGVALIFFDTIDKIEQMSAIFNKLRKNLHNYSSNTEFHAFDDSPETREKVLHAIAELDFHYIFYAIEKDATNKKVASYQNIAKGIIDKVVCYHLDFKITRMDQNPILKKCLLEEAKRQSVHLHCKEVRSSSYDGVQLADYIVFMSTRKMRKLKINAKLWREIEKKRLA